MEKNIKYKKQSLKERFEKKILDQSMAELIRLNEYFKNTSFNIKKLFLH